MLRRFLARTQAALLWCSRPERHRRKMARELALPLRELSPVDAAEYDRLAEGIQAWKTGEMPIVVAEVVEEFKPGIYTYPEPIGPQLPTVDERFAAFAADPLGAELPGVPAKDNVLFAEALASVPLPPEVRDDLELTGSWSVGFLAKLARGER